MTILCVACRRPIRVPDARAANPRLKVKCGCGALFALSEAQIAAMGTQPVSAPPRPAAAPAPAAAQPAGRPAPAPRPALQAPPAGPLEGAPKAVARPAPPPAAGPPLVRPPAPSRVSFQATAGLGSASVPRQGPRAAWRTCGSHPQARSASVCPRCLTGYCSDCQQKVGVSVICAKCEVICLEPAAYEESLERERRRARPMMEELSTIIGYPLRDPMAYVMLAVFTWVFAALGNLAVLYGKGVAILFSQGVLMAYCFSALSRVSGGNLQDFMPDIGDITDLVRTLRLGVAALVAGSGPLLILMLVIPGLALTAGWGQPQAREEIAETQPAPVPPAFSEDEPGVADAEPVAAGQPPAPAPDAAGGLKLVGLALSVLLLGGLGLAWKLIYTPVALAVAGISRSVWPTLNPVVGFDVIRRMGGTYWQAMGIYTVIAVVEWLIGFVFGYVPVLGGIVRAFLDAYAYLMIGCTLGLAVFKKAPELGLE